MTRRPRATWPPPARPTSSRSRSPLDMSQPDFAARVQRAVAELPDDVRRDLGGIKVEAADLPDIGDLVAEKPPLSPTILGLVPGPAARLHRARGPDACGPRRQGAGAAGAAGQRRRRWTRRGPPRRRRAICSATRASGRSSSTGATCCAPCTTSTSWTRPSRARCCTRSATSGAKTTAPCAIAVWSNLPPDLISVRGVTKDYGEPATAATGVPRSTTCRSRSSGAEIVGLLGPNGAGKTTLMRILSCFLTPTRGTAVLDGRSIADDTRGVRRALGYLPEAVPLPPEMRVTEYLGYRAALKGDRARQAAGGGRRRHQHRRPR